MPSAPRAYKPRPRRQWYGPVSGAFVGRADELADVSELLLTSGLVTITGAAGVGKTSLALRAAEHAASRFRQGVSVIEVSALRDPELLYHAIVSSLGLPGMDGRPSLTALTGSLRERSLLIVLDGCEYLLRESASFAESVLRDAAGVRILATSRQSLAVPGEAVFRLGPMRVPGPADTRAEGDAVELFTQRAAAVVPGFSVTVANQSAVARICRRLDGVPAAIELAAVRLRALDVAELSAKLDRRILTQAAGGRRVAERRCNTLRSAMDWSYDLCWPAERQLWARLSVFAGPFSADAVDDVCPGGDLSRGQVRSALLGLAAQSVVVPVDGPETRFRILDTIRDYGGEKLAGSPDAEEVRARHARRYLRLARELTPGAGTAHGLPAGYLALRAEHDDIRAALTFAFATPGQERTGTRLAVALYWYWMMSGLVQEGRHWLSRALSRPGASSRELVQALLLHGVMLAALGDPAAGAAGCETGLAMALGRNDVNARARGHLIYCRALFAAGQLDEAYAAARRAVTLMDEADDSPAQFRK